MRVFWTEHEIEDLKYYYLTLGLSISEFIDEYIKKYPFRTKASIEVKIGKLKLKHTNEQIFLIKSRLNSGEKNGMFGKKGPNKGLNKENSCRILEASKKISKTRIEMSKRGELPSTLGEKNGMYGKESWSKGKTKYTDDRLLSTSKKLTKVAKDRWISLSEDEKTKRIGELALAANKARKDTSIEIIIREVLDDLNIKFTKNYRCDRYVFDFYLKDYNFVIECQGDYWHGNPEFFKELNEIQSNNIERDKRKVEYLLKNEIKFLFLWENFIKRNKDNLPQIILSSLK